MEQGPDFLKDLDPLALTNTVTLSALVALLVRKGLLTEEELREEIRVLRERMGKMR